MADKKIRRIFLCRHGKTEANEKGVYSGGESESPLNNEGRKQAIFLGKALANYYKFQGKMIITSASKRAQETGKIIAGCLKPKPLLLHMEGLREIELGEWSGKTNEEIHILFTKKHELWLKGELRPDFRFPGGESLEEVQKRAQDCYRLVKKIWLGNDENDNNDLIIVAHGGTNMMILADIMKAGLKTHAFRIIRQDNTCINIIHFRGKTTWRPEIQIALINSTHHLDIDFSKIKSSA